MTRKDFVALAEAIKAAKPGFAVGPYVDGCNDQWQWMAERTADVCAKDNPRFDRERFLAACGVAK